MSANHWSVIRTPVSRRRVWTSISLPNWTAPLCCFEAVKGGFFELRGLGAGFDFIDINSKCQVQHSARLGVGCFCLSVSVLIVLLFVEFFLERLVRMGGSLVELEPAVQAAANLFHGQFSRPAFVEALTNTTA